MRNAYRDRLLTVHPRDGGLALVAVNGSGQRWHDTVVVTRRALDGAVLATTAMSLDRPSGGTTVLLPAQMTEPADPAGELPAVRNRSGTGRAWWHFVEDVDGDLPAADLDSHLSTIDGGYRLKVTVRSLTRDLAALADRVATDAVVDDTVTSVPGETATFTNRTTGTVRPSQLTDPWVLRSANQLVTAGSDKSARP